MSFCPEECAARRRLARDALFNAHVAEAMGHVIKGAAEIIGMKEKTGVAEEEAKAEEPPRRKAKA